MQELHCIQTCLPSVNSVKSAAAINAHAQYGWELVSILQVQARGAGTDVATIVLKREESSVPLEYKFEPVKFGASSASMLTNALKSECTDGWILDAVQTYGQNGSKVVAAYKRVVPAPVEEVDDPLVEIESDKEEANVTKRPAARPGGRPRINTPALG